MYTRMPCSMETMQLIGLVICLISTLVSSLYQFSLVLFQAIITAKHSNLYSYTSGVARAIELVGPRTGAHVQRFDHAH